MSVVAEQHRLFRSGQRNTRTTSAAMDQVRLCCSREAAGLYGMAYSGLQRFASAEGFGLLLLQEGVSDVCTCRLGGFVGIIIRGCTRKSAIDFCITTGGVVPISMYVCTV